MKYKIYYEFNGKKLRSTIEAEDRDEAEEILRQKIKIVAIHPEFEEKKPDKDWFDDQKIKQEFIDIFGDNETDNFHRN